MTLFLAIALALQEAVAPSLTALDARWQVSFDTPPAAPAGYDTSGAYVPLKGGQLVAVDLDRGVVRWRLDVPTAFTPATGDTVWTRTLTGRIVALKGLDDQLVFGTTDKWVQSVDLERGRERWKWRVGGDVAGLPSADDKRIYFASRDNVLRAVDRKSGNLRWKAMLPSRPAGGPLRLPDAVMVPLVASEIPGFDPVTGKPSTTIKAAGELGSQPFLRPDARLTAPRLIVVSREGQLQAFGLRFEPPFMPLDVLPGAPAVP